MKLSKKNKRTIEKESPMDRNETRNIKLADIYILDN